MIRQPRFHCRRNAQGLVNPAEVVVDVVKGDSGNMVFNLLRERVRKPGEAAHLHAHREILPFNVAGVHVLRVGVSDLGFFGKNILANSMNAILLKAEGR